MSQARVISAGTSALPPSFEVHYLELPTSIANIDTYFVAPEQESWTPALASFAETLRDAVVVDEPQLTAS